MRFAELPVGDDLYVKGQWAIMKNNEQIGVITHLRDSTRETEMWFWRLVIFGQPSRVRAFDTWEETQFHLALENF